MDFAGFNNFKTSSTSSFLNSVWPTFAVEKATNSGTSSDVCVCVCVCVCVIN